MALQHVLSSQGSRLAVAHLAPRLSSTSTPLITHANCKQFSFFGFAFFVPAAINLRIPSLIADIWDSVLRAVPKKKTSHMKKRHRQMAGKALKDVTALNRCSACGSIKRAHLLCPYCVKDIKDMWLGKKVQKDQELETTSTTS